jgi:hypothetical protein
MTTQRNASATPTSTDTLGNRVGFGGRRKWHFGKHDKGRSYWLQFGIAKCPSVSHRNCVETLLAGFGYSVIDLGNVRDGGLIQQAGGPLAGRNLLEEGERHQ